MRGAACVSDENGPVPLRIVVAVATSGRTGLLLACLASLREMAPPQGCEVTLLVVDNDPSATARQIIGAASASEPGASQPYMRTVYAHEARPGIPFARNRAIDEALNRGADLLCFIDDDERAAKDWLAALVGCHRATGAELIGGPVFVAGPPPEADLRQRAINASLQARAERKMARTARAARASHKFTVVTNNWLCDLRWQRRTGLRFDERLQFTGGSDTAFFRAARAAGCNAAWCPAARVFETQTPDRLSAGYQFRRASAQSLNHFRMKRAEMSMLDFVATPLTAAVKLALGAMLLIVPVYGRASPVIALRSIGWSHGRIRAMLGGVSRLYEAPDR